MKSLQLNNSLTHCFRGYAVTPSIDSEEFICKGYQHPGLHVCDDFPVRSSASLANQLRSKLHCQLALQLFHFFFTVLVL